MKKLTLFLILNFSLLILFTSCYTWYESKVPMDSDTEQASLADFFYQKPEITSLEAPTQVIASQGLYKDTIKLRWSEVDNATSYRIERAIITDDSDTMPDESDFAVIEKYIYKTTYDDSILSNASEANDEYGYKYYYRICAENIKKGYESSEYTDISNPDTAAAGWLLQPPKNIDAWKGKDTNAIKITWNHVADAKYYILYRSEKMRTGYEEIATIRGNQNYYIDEIADSEQGTEYYYKVCAKLASGSTSANSSYALGYSLKKGAPKAPDSVSIDNGLGTSTSSIKINWDNTSVSVTSDQTLTFSVYRTSSVDSTFTQIFANLDSSFNSVTDASSLKAGVYYYYYVQSVITENGEITKSAFSETGPESANPAVGFLLSAPSAIEISDSSSSGTVMLRWTPAAGYEEPYNNSYSYNLYYAYNLTDTYTLISNQTPDLGEDGYYEFEVTKYPFYKISTVNAGGTESALSSVVAPTPAAPENVMASKTSHLGGLSNFSYNSNEVYPVKITWSVPSAETPYGYNIYRSTKRDSSFRKLNDKPVTDANYFIDENETARAGTYYFYKVVSVNSLEQGKKGNDPTTDTKNNCRGYGAITREQWFREYNKTIMNSQSKLTLMHKPNDMDKLGTETINGNCSGTLKYTAAIAGLGAEITMHYENYCDYYIENNKASGPYFTLTGNTDTTSNMSANGNMHEKVTCTGMYPGYAIYDNLEIKSGAAGGGYYLVQTKDLSGSVILDEAKVDWLVGEQH